MNTAILTIDDIASRNTPAMVDYFLEKGIRAVFFATGMNVEKFWEEAKYAVRSGMTVGNHSYSHPHFSELGMEEAVDEIERCEALLDRLYAECGMERKVRLFRFPYGDKGGENRAALQAYLRDHGYNKIDDRHIPYAWWQESELKTDLDHLWTYDVEEYRLHLEPGFDVERIWAKMREENPTQGAALFAPENRHIILMHAHDETEAILPGYYRLFIDYMLQRGLTFDHPQFL